MKKVILSLVLVIGFTTTYAQIKKLKPTTLKTEMEKISYSLGLNVAIGSRTSKKQIGFGYLAF